MKKISATQAKNNLGRVLISAMSNPVIITKNNKDIAVVVSSEIYEKMINLTSKALENIKNNAEKNRPCP